MININKNGEYTVYAFYLKKDKKLYAFTINKEYKDSFKKIRNMNKFIYTKLYMDELTLSIFQDKNYLKMLTKVYLSNSNDIKEYHTIIATYDEEYLLEKKSSDISDNLVGIKIYMHRLNLKKEYVNAIKYLTEINNPNDSTISNINTLKLFYHLFKNTF